MHYLSMEAHLVWEIAQIYTLRNCFLQKYLLEPTKELFLQK